MANIQAQIWKGSTFTIERKEGKAPGTVIFHLSGPFTARDMYNSMTPAALHNLFELQSPEGVRPATLHIFDLSDVPYMDSMGLGMLVSQHVRCQAKGVRLIAAGVGPRVMQLFKLTKVDAILATAATVEEAEMKEA